MDDSVTVVTPEKPSVEETREPQPRMPDIDSRFMYVGVSAQRAKQLRRGALPRLAHLRPHPETGVRPEMPPKLERVAMDEVKEGLIVYELPAKKKGGPEGKS